MLWGVKQDLASWPGFPTTVTACIASRRSIGQKQAEKRSDRGFYFMLVHADFGQHLAGIGAECRTAAPMPDGEPSNRIAGRACRSRPAGCWIRSGHCSSAGAICRASCPDSSASLRPAGPRRCAGRWMPWRRSTARSSTRIGSRRRPPHPGLRPGAGRQRQFLDALPRHRRRRAWCRPARGPAYLAWSRASSGRSWRSRR